MLKNGAPTPFRSAEAVERARLEAEFQAKIGTLEAEVQRMREELALRTMIMADETDKWRQQSQLTASAVMEAKTEVEARKRELDQTKDKMDRLLDKLYMVGGLGGRGDRLLDKLYMEGGLGGGGTGCWTRCTWRVGWGGDGGGARPRTKGQAAWKAVYAGGGDG